MNIPDVNVNTALIALLGSIVGWLLRDFSRRLDGLPARVAEALSPTLVLARESAMTQVGKRFDNIDDRLERSTRAIELSARVELLRIMSQPDASPRVKQEVEGLLREINGVR